MPTQMPEKRPAAAVDRLGDRLDHAVGGVELAAAIGKGAVAGQHDMIGLRHDGGIGRHHDRSPPLPVRAAASSSALPTECRLPAP